MRLPVCLSVSLSVHAMSIHHHWDYKFCTHLSQNAKQGALSTSIGPTQQHIHSRFHLKVWHNTKTATASHTHTPHLRSPSLPFNVNQPTHSYFKVQFFDQGIFIWCYKRNMLNCKPGKEEALKGIQLSKEIPIWETSFPLCDHVRKYLHMHNTTHAHT